MANRSYLQKLILDFRFHLQLNNLIWSAIGARRRDAVTTVIALLSPIARLPITPQPWSSALIRRASTDAGCQQTNNNQICNPNNWTAFEPWSSSLLCSLAYAHLWVLFDDYLQLNPTSCRLKLNPTTKSNNQILQVTALPSSLVSISFCIERSTQLQLSYKVMRTNEDEQSANLINFKNRIQFLHSMTRPNSTNRLVAYRRTGYQPASNRLPIRLDFNRF